jgi:hypothetical protein
MAASEIGDRVKIGRIRAMRPREFLTVEKMPGRRVRQMILQVTRW